jgi:hypothetical protein
MRDQVILFHKYFYFSFDKQNVGNYNKLFVSKQLVYNGTDF